MAKLKDFSRLVKFEHTIFAFPFALIGFFWGLQHTENQFSWWIFLLVLLCMVFARNAAMGFNRYLDRFFDAANPRTALREIPAGVIKSKSVLIFVIINALFFIATTYFINNLVFYLSPVALFVILFYSYTKRFTPLCHFVLSLGLALAPIGAYLAVTGVFHIVPIFLSAIVFFWVSGFDIIYALQDEAFDKEYKLKSIPTLMGRTKALNFSRFIHFLSAIFIYVFAMSINANWLQWIASAIFMFLLFYQQILVKPNDLSKVNLAFFTTNGIASVVYGTLIIVGMII